MYDWKKALVASDATIGEAIEIIDASALQICLVVDDEGRLLGTVTDGDVRRGLIRTRSLSVKVSEVMKSNPTVGTLDADHAIHLDLMQRASVRQLPLLDAQRRVVGLVLRDDIQAPAPHDNWVVLMAGGLGQRLRPMTEDTPKPLLKVGRKPLLETILESFIQYDFRRFFISVNYKADRVKEYFGSGSRWNVDIRYLEEGERLGTAGALGLINHPLDAPIIVMNGDVLTKANFNQLLAFHSEQGARATMCVREYDFQVPFGVVDIDHGRIMGIREKPVHTFFVNAGIYVLDPGVLSVVPKEQSFDMTDLFEAIISRGQPTAVFPVREYWLDIGHANDFDRANGEYPKVFESN